MALPSATEFTTPSTRASLRRTQCSSSQPAICLCVTVTRPRELPSWPGPPSLGTAANTSGEPATGPRQFVTKTASARATIGVESTRTPCVRVLAILCANYISYAYAVMSLRGLIRSESIARGTDRADLLSPRGGLGQRTKMPRFARRAIHFSPPGLIIRDFAS